MINATTFIYPQRSQIIADTVEPSFLSKKLISKHARDLGLDYLTVPGNWTQAVHVQSPASTMLSHQNRAQKLPVFCTS